MNVDLVTKWQIITSLKNMNQVCLWIKIQISTLLLVRDCLTDVMSCLRLMGTWWLMTTVHHDHDITWPYDRDMTITTRILPTQHLWWSTKISWIHSSLQRLRIFKFMNIWPEMHWAGGGLKYLQMAGSRPFLWPGGVLGELCGHRENGAE